VSEKEIEYPSFVMRKACKVFCWPFLSFLLLKIALARVVALMPPAPETLIAC
jgi:hypothetical protein